MTRLRLRTRLTLWFAGSILLILVPAMAAVLSLQWRAMRAALDHHLEEDLEVAAEMLVAAPEGLAWRTDSTRDLGYDAGEQRWVEVYALDAQPLYFRGIPAIGTVRSAMPAPSRDTAGYQTLITPAGARTRVLTAVRRVGPAEVWLRVARSEDGLRADVRWLLILFGLLTPVAVAGAALAGYVISGRALLPLARMAERARSISADRLSERLPVENPADELGRLAGVFNETFARLEESFARLRRFTADASHQLRTPLTAIRSVGEVGLRSARTPGDYQEVIGSMLEECDRLGSLVDALLTLSRWESGRVARTPSRMDLAEVAREVVGQLSVLAEEQGVTVDIDLPAPLRTSADPVMVRTAIMNVVDNAIKFSPAGRRVRVWSRTDTSHHHVIVDDDGPGIPAQLRDRVVERFYRLEDGPAGEVAGFGLGLAIADWALKANQGRIVLESSESGGARVVLTLLQLG